MKVAPQQMETRALQPKRENLYYDMTWTDKRTHTHTLTHTHAHTELALCTH